MEKYIGCEPRAKIISEDEHGALMATKSVYEYDEEHYKIIYISGSPLSVYNDGGYCTQIINLDQSNYGHTYDPYNDKLKPYIFKYKLSKHSNTKLYAASLLEQIKKLETNRIVLISKNEGNLIALHLNDSPLIEQIYAVNPALFGSPLTHFDKLRLLKDYRYAVIKYMAYRAFQRKVCLKKEIDSEIDFSKLSKTHVIGGTINGLIPNSVTEKVMQAGAIAIATITGEKSDGMLVWDEEKLKNNNVRYTELDKPYYSNTQNEEYMGKVLEIVKRNVKL